MKRRTIAVVTGTRAEYGLLAPLIERLEAAKDVRLLLLVTGAHLSRRHGLTLREIERDGHRIAARVPLGDSEHGAHATAAAIARGVEGFSRVYGKLKPELVVVLGDRFEILAAAAAALPHRIPVAHIHGGESTDGAWDESLRHAVTKLSHLHFPADPAYARRIRAMGEDPASIRCFGSPGWDRIASVPRVGRARLESELGLPLRAPVFLVTYHPETLSGDRGRRGFQALLKSLGKRRGTILFTYPNADAGSAAITGDLEAFVRANRGHAAAFRSLGQRLYFSALAQADVVVGNSSSALLEAPFFGVPAVNLGARQAGRLRGPNVIDVPAPSPASIGRALDKALSPTFRRSVRARALPKGSPSGRIAEVLRRAPLGDRLIRKSFHDR